MRTIIIYDLIDICEYRLGSWTWSEMISMKINHTCKIHKFQYSFKTVLILKYTFGSVYTNTRINSP